jgi:hypothetical protein
VIVVRRKIDMKRGEKKVRTLFSIFWNIIRRWRDLLISYMTLVDLFEFSS